MNIYYVYAYLRKSNNQPYYIGKGKDKRAWTKHNGISVPKDKTKIVLLETNLTELGALALERRMIRWYGRKDLGTGILLNKTDGGEGTSGFRHTEETKRRLSESFNGKKLPPRSVEHSRNLSLSLIGKRQPNISAALTGKRQPNISASKIGKPQVQVTCPHCKKTGGNQVMKRWHFSNCKGLH